MKVKTYQVKLTEAELWYLVNAIPQAGYEDDSAGQSANDKISAAHSRAVDGDLSSES